MTLLPPGVLAAATAAVGSGATANVKAGKGAHQRNRILGDVLSPCPVVVSQSFIRTETITG